MRRLVSLVSLLALGALAPVPAVAATEPTHPFTVHDLLAMERLSDYQVSPDGTRILFDLRRTDLEANKGRYDLWLIGADGQGLRQLTTHEAADTGGRWAPDGRTIYFLSTRSGSNQVWKLSLDGGEPQQVTNLPLDVDNLSVSPDGKTLVFSAEVFVDCATLQCTKERLTAREKNPASGRVFERLFIRHWDTWEDGLRAHLFAWPLAGGEPVDVSKGMDADAPTKPFGGTEEVAFTPDGKGLVFAARDVGREEAWSTNVDLFYAPLDGSASAKNLTAANQATDTQPVFSPDGKTLAYLAMKRPGFEADRYRIVLRDWASGATRILTEAWDRTPEGLLWARDGKTIYAAAGDVGQKGFFAIDATSGDARRIYANGWAGLPQWLGDGRLVFGLEHLRSPVELYALRVDGGGLAPITRINAPHVAAVRFGEPEQMSFKGAGGDTVFTYIVKPVDFDPAKKYPVAFLIHGGPQGSFGNDFHYRWNPQTYAGRGYAAVMVDFHGSTGYGQAFQDAIRDDWGGKPLEDLKKGLDAALVAYPWMDGDRVCALGASYGGYMINWIAGNWPDRFRCLVAHDGNLDERFAYYGTEELWFPEWEHGGTPWQNPAGYEKHNPVNFVKNWKTPILVIHGGQDFRIVDAEGFGTFTAAQRMGIPSKLLYFPDENHWVLKPRNSILWHDTVLDWLDRWAKGAPAN